MSERCEMQAAVLVVANERFSIELVVLALTTVAMDHRVMIDGTMVDVLGVGIDDLVMSRFHVSMGLIAVEDTVRCAKAMVFN